MKISKDYIARIVKTFLETVVGYLAVAIPTLDFGSVSKKILVGVGVSAISAGVTAIINLDKATED